MQADSRYIQFTKNLIINIADFSFKKRLFFSKTVAALFSKIACDL